MSEFENYTGTVGLPGVHHVQPNQGRSIKLGEWMLLQQFAPLAEASVVRIVLAPAQDNAVITIGDDRGNGR